MNGWSFDRHGAVAVLTFRRPPVNLIDFAALLELGDLLERCAAEPEGIKVVVLAGGTPGYFVNHADLADLERAGKGLVPPEELGSWDRALRLLEEIPQPTVAAIDGLASGGGNELALACTVRIGSVGARLEQPEVSVGIIPGGGGTVRLSRLVGPGVTADAVLTGRTFDADEAVRVGWLTLLLPGDDFFGEVLRWTGRVAAAPAAALSSAKRSIVAGSRMPFADAQQLEKSLFRALSANNTALREDSNA
ncbi:enoyl-CoA hydratase-related protein [Amycolatopsis granulosa]|uniref:enoyl-CoA hydratase-related protein n=1 Tax=Amycolatopsis granulosa TaxID=185684 RepID=UPI0014200D52|nr:enoyl-CoA hydratase/carnithine racemase [Amycolatopsis granulosa]